MSGSEIVLPWPLSTLEYLCDAAKELILEPLGGRLLTELTKPLYNALENNALGMPLDRMCFLICFLTAYTLAIVFRNIPRNNVFEKHIMAMTVGIGFSIFCFGYTGLHVLFLALLCYGCMAFLPHGIAHRVVYVLAFGYLSVCHVYRMFVDYAGINIDFSTIMMMSMLKMVSCAVNYYDGNVSESDPYAQAIHPVHHELKIKQLPALYEYLSYIYFFPVTLTGPIYDIKYYQDFINNYYMDSIPWNIPDLLKKIAMVVISAIGFSLIPYFPREFVWEPENLEKATLLYRLVYCFAMPAAFTFRYYLVWYLAEVAGTLAGLGMDMPPKLQNPSAKFHPITNPYSYNAVKQSELISFELATTVKELTDNWNISVSRWLKKYVYLRVTDVKTKPGLLNLLASFTMSALWHGFYPGYYLFFVTAAFGAQLSRIMRKKLRPHFIKREIRSFSDVTPASAFYNVAGWFMTQYACYYMGCAFVLLSVEDPLRLWKSTYFIVPLCIPVFWVVLSNLPTPRSATNQPSRNQRSAPHDGDSLDEVVSTHHVGSADSAAATHHSNGNNNSNNGHFFQNAHHDNNGTQEVTDEQSTSTVTAAATTTTNEYVSLQVGSEQLHHQPGNASIGSGRGGPIKRDTVKRD